MKICLHQFIRPKIYVRLAGVGNCLTCQPHPDNKNCKEYTPITIVIFEEEDDDDQLPNL